MHLTARHLALASLLIGLPLLQAAGNRHRSSACAVTGPAGCAGSTRCPAATCPLGQADTTPTASLDAAVLDAFRAQYAEEQMAARVYRALAATHPEIRPFQNIPRAEDRHAGAIAALLAAQPASAPNPTMTINPTYARLGDDLIARGQPSETDALRVGAYIEEKDILDLRALATRVDHADARALIAQLEQGSHHHLSAFVRQLHARGQTYTPQLLTAEDFAQILPLGS